MALSSPPNLQVQAKPTTGIIIVGKDIITRSVWETGPLNEISERSDGETQGSLNHVWTERRPNENSRPVDRE